MTRLIGGGALLLTASATLAQPNSFEGHWANAEQSVIVSVSRCGDDYCAVVVKASDKVEANARKGGTLHFVGTQILRVHAAGRDAFKGKAFDPESNLHVNATVTVLGPTVMNIKGCAFLGLICDQQRWTKVD